MPKVNVPSASNISLFLFVNFAILGSAISAGSPPKTGFSSAQQTIRGSSGSSMPKSVPNARSKAPDSGVRNAILGSVISAALIIIDSIYYQFLKEFSVDKNINN
jgi:hypothetical protein